MVGILVLVYQHMAETPPLGVQHIGTLLQHAFQLEKQIVIIQQSMFPAIGGIGLAQPDDIGSMGQQMLRLPPQHVFQLHFLVAGLGQQADDRLYLGEGAIPLADVQGRLAVLNGGAAVRAVHDAQPRAAFEQPFRLPAAQYGKGEGVEGAALNARKLLRQQHGRAMQHFLRGLARKREQKHGRRITALLHQPGQAVNNGARFAASRARNDQKRPFACGDGLALGFVEHGNIKHGRRPLA